MPLSASPPEFPAAVASAEDPAYLSRQLITYLGNKRALLPFLGRALGQVRRRLGGRRLAIADLFSGTGVVARYAKQHAASLHVNDLEPYSEAVNRCFLANASEVDPGLLEATRRRLAARIEARARPGFLAELYAPQDDHRIRAGDRVFYTRRNAVYLDTARQELDRLPAPLRRFFLGPLLAAASVHANTSGVFKGFHKNRRGLGQFGGTGRDALSRILRDIQVETPVLSRFDCDVAIHRRDANALVRELPALDLAYLDPPYNQHPYGSNYFMLNLLVDYERPAAVSRVSGIPTDWNRSRYNRRAEAAEALFELVAACPARFLLISYNSEGFIPHAVFLRRLREHGRCTVCATRYNAFRGSRNLHGRPLHLTEYLYLLEKRSA
jgi:adenine-specific DNA-methyltransferase